MERPVNQTIAFSTGTGTLALLDPALLRDNAHPHGWSIAASFADLPDVRQGRIALVDIGSDGTWRVRVTAGDLLPEEKDYATEKVGSLGIQVTSGTLFVGGGAEEAPPAGSTAEGRLMAIPNGAYDVMVFRLDISDSARGWAEADADALADFVAVIRARMRPFAEVTQHPSLPGDNENFLFTSKTR